MNEELNVIVKRILTPFARPAHTPVEIDVDGETFLIERAQFILHYYQSHIATRTHKTIGLFKSMMRQHIETNYFDMYCYKHSIEMNGFPHRSFDYRNIEDPNFQKFAVSLYRKVNSSKSKMHILFVRIVETIQSDMSDDLSMAIKSDLNAPDRAHENVFLFYADYSGQINAYVYDAHGSDSSASMQYMRNEVDLFILFLSNVFRKMDIKLMIQPRTALSCPRGLQRVSNEQFGFCVMFAYLWIYVVLNFIENGIAPTFAIEFAETCVLDFVSSPDKLFAIVLNFSIQMIDWYMEYLSRMNKQQRVVEDVLETFKADIRQGKVKIINKRPRSIRRERSPVLSDERGARKGLGKPCKKHDECETDYCEKEFCRENPLFMDSS